MRHAPRPKLRVHLNDGDVGLAKLQRAMDAALKLHWNRDGKTTQGWGSRDLELGGRACQR
jgi:hypothetical protein